MNTTGIIIKSIIIGLFCSLFISPVSAQIPGTLPIFFTPTRSLVGDQIALHALVRNTQNQKGTLTIAFTTIDGEQIGTQSELIENNTEKILIVPWVMPETPVVVSATVIRFVGEDTVEKTLSLPLRSMTVAPSEKRQSALFLYFEKVKVFLERYRLSWLSDIEEKRDDLKNSAPEMRDRIGNAIEIAETGSLQDRAYGETKQTLGNQILYYSYGILRAALASATIFYTLVVLFTAAIVKFVFSKIL